MMNEESRKPSAIAIEYELKPCPFCSSQFLHLRKMKGLGWFIDCGDCGGNSGYPQTKETAVSFWNFRKNPITISVHFLNQLIETFLKMKVLEEEGVAVVGLEARSRIVYELLSVHGEQSGEPPWQSHEVFFPPETDRDQEIREMVEDEFLSSPDSPLDSTMAGAEMVLAALSETQGIFTQIFEAVGEELQFQGIRSHTRYNI